MPETLDSALKRRLRAVLDHQAVTEAELRKLFEEGSACDLIVAGLLGHAERELAERESDPDSSLTDIASAFRSVHELRADLDELRSLLAALEPRAREFRASWLSTR